jgi:sugar phosphate isomerase/epimerase
MARIPVALQLYSVRHECERDLPGTLASVAKMGYDGVEFAGFYGYSAGDLRKLLEDNGLKTAGAHVGLDTLSGDELARSIDFHRELGNRFLIVPGLPDHLRSSRAAWLETAARFNAVADALRPHGLRTGYHNHTVEFAPMDGEKPWDTLFGNTAFDVVMQIDTGNALEGGADAAEYLERYPGRATTVHLKEFPDGLIGEGNVRWNEVFRLCEQPGNTEWYIVEQEGDKYPPLEYVDRWLQKFRAMGK